MGAGTAQVTYDSQRFIEPLDAVFALDSQARHRLSTAAIDEFLSCHRIVERVSQWDVQVVFMQELPDAMAKRAAVVLKELIILGHR